MTETARGPWTAETVPPELVAILDEQAGIVHSATGSVRRCLADILNQYDEMRDGPGQCVCNSIFAP